MTAPTAPTAAPGAPLVQVHAHGLLARQVSPTQALVVLHNPVVHASALLTADELRAVVDQLAALAGQLEETPATSQLVLPDAAGKLTVPGGDR